MWPQVKKSPCSHTIVMTLTNSLCPLGVGESMQSYNSDDIDRFSLSVHQVQESPCSHTIVMTLTDSLTHTPLVSHRVVMPLTDSLLHTPFVGPLAVGEVNDLGWVVKIPLLSQPLCGLVISNTPGLIVLDQINQNRSNSKEQP